MTSQRARLTQGKIKMSDFMVDMNLVRIKTELVWLLNDITSRVILWHYWALFIHRNEENVHLAIDNLLQKIYH